MNHPRRGRPSGRGSYHKELVGAIGRYLPHRGLPLRMADRRVRWTDRLLVSAALLMGWQRGVATQQEAFQAAREVVVTMYGSRRRPGRNLSGFVKGLTRRGGALCRRVVARLRRTTQRLAGPAWRYAGYVPMAVDGTRIACPRTEANEAAFGTGAKPQGMPQQQLTTVFHPGVGLPWDWRGGRGDASERAHLQEMLGALPSATLLLMDAGYTGFALLAEVLSRGQAFIVRVGRNVQLLRELGYAVREDAGTVYLWPQRQQDQAPLVLRLVEVRSGGTPVYLLSSVRDKTRLSDEAIATLYRQRWGVELLYRGFKQTLSKRRMLSTRPASARMELDWALLGLWMLGLLSGEAIAEAGGAAASWSVAETQRVIGRAMRRAHAWVPTGSLRRQLAGAVKDRYRRHQPKASRDYPRQKVTKPPGAPRIRTATSSEVQRARELRKRRDAA
jgi:hypothetical protein